jgi:hypothetical protein
MALTHAVVSVNNLTPTLLTPAGVEPGVSLSIQVQNISSGTVYVGGENLTTSSYGAALTPGSTLGLDRLARKDEVFALSQGASGQVAVLTVQR